MMQTTDYNVVMQLIVWHAVLVHSNNHPSSPHDLQAFTTLKESIGALIQKKKTMAANLQQLITMTRGIDSNSPQFDEAFMEAAYKCRTSVIEKIGELDQKLAHLLGTAVSVDGDAIDTGVPLDGVVGETADYLNVDNNIDALQESMETVKDLTKAVVECVTKRQKKHTAFPSQGGGGGGGDIPASHSPAPSPTPHGSHVSLESALQISLGRNITNAKSVQ